MRFNLWALLFPGNTKTHKGTKKKAFELLRRVLQQPVTGDVSQATLAKDIRFFLAKHDKKNS